MRSTVTAVLIAFLVACAPPEEEPTGSVPGVGSSFAVMSDQVQLVTPRAPAEFPFPWMLTAVGFEGGALELAIAPGLVEGEELVQGCGAVGGFEPGPVEGDGSFRSGPGQFYFELPRRNGLMPMQVEDARVEATLDGAGDLLHAVTITGEVAVEPIALWQERTVEDLCERAPNRYDTPCVDCADPKLSGQQCLAFEMQLGEALLDPGLASIGALDPLCE